jgi:hypothetical protein
MTRRKPTTGDVDHSCVVCGRVPEPWGPLYVLDKTKTEYLCESCYRATLRRAA